MAEVVPESVERAEPVSTQDMEVEAESAVAAAAGEQPDGVEKRGREEQPDGVEKRGREEVADGEEEEEEEGGASKKQKVEEPSSEKGGEESKAAAGKVKLGPKEFGSSVEMFNYFYKFLHFWTPNIDVNEYEHMVLLDLLKKGHAEPEKKIGEGIQAFQVRFHPMWKSRCFFLVNVNGGSDDFSFRKCVDNILPLPESMKLVNHRSGDAKPHDGRKEGGRGGGRGRGGRGGRGRGFRGGRRGGR